MKNSLEISYEVRQMQKNLETFVKNSLEISYEVRQIQKKLVTVCQLLYVDGREIVML